MFGVASPEDLIGEKPIDLVHEDDRAGLLESHRSLEPGQILPPHVARRFVSYCRSTDIIARMGGDEIAIIATHLKETSGAGNLAEKILSSINAPFALDGHMVHVGISIGVTTYPDAFIEIAETSNLIGHLGEWVLRDACRTAARWAEHGPLRVPVAVNLSAAQLAMPSLLVMIERALGETGLPPDLLELEITESVMIPNLQGSQKVLKHLQ